MAFWNDHQMAIVIGKFVHHHKGILTLIKDEVFFILLLPLVSYKKYTPFLFLLKYNPFSKEPKDISSFVPYFSPNFWD